MPPRPAPVRLKCGLEKPAAAAAWLAHGLSRHPSAGRPASIKSYLTAPASRLGAVPHQTWPGAVWLIHGKVFSALAKQLPSPWSPV
jgi:hypothetical protein